MAAAAGRTSGAVYAHFGSKQGLLLALLDSWQQSFLAVLFAEVAVTDEPIDQLGAVWGNIGKGTDERVRRWMLLEHELWLRAARDPDVAQVLQARNRETQPRSERELAWWASEVGSQPVAEPGQLAILVKALLHGLAMQEARRPRIGDRRDRRGRAGRTPRARYRGHRHHSRHRRANHNETGAPVMNTEIRQRLGIEFPIFAFTHCRDVVAAVSNAGGIGVLGAIAFNPEQLEVELNWIDEHVGDNPYGVDIVIPAKYEGMDEMDPEKLEAQLQGDGAPHFHREFARKLLADHGVPEIPRVRRRSSGHDGLDGRPCPTG